MMDLVLEAWVSGVIELTKIQWMLGANSRWTPGEKLRLLFAGYNGTRNTGSDVRVEEMLRQVRRILGGENLALSVMTQSFERSRGYFGDARQVHLPAIFPPFLYDEVRCQHGVIACEGSMFKSKFANALTTMMIGSLGIAAVENKLSVGYGAEAGDMDRLLRKMVQRYCADSLIITRNQESQILLNELGVPTELGSDTAWTFEPLEPEYGQQALRAAGWDGSRQVLVICHINPFWWPVKASVGKLALYKITGAYKQSHYRSVYFHTSGPEVDAAYARYLAAFSNAVNAFRRERDVFPVMVATERLDRDACARIADALAGAPVITSDDYDMYQLVSILRAAHLMISSRYHGIVTSMPGLVPSAGITMDERIRNIMNERGHQHLLFEVDDPELEGKLLEAMRTLCRDREAIQDAIAQTVARNLKNMARMGVYFEEHVQRCYPDFPLRGGHLTWEDYLPPLSPTLCGLLEHQAA
jgi:polysaccharide pyruvyl transferase WcaK-like protein